jgi:hypothetical protein
MLLFAASAIVFGQFVGAAAEGLTGNDPILIHLVKIPAGILVGAVLGEVFVARHLRRR